MYYFVLQVIIKIKGVQMKTSKISFGLVSSIIIFSLAAFLFSSLDNTKEQKKLEKTKEENYVFCDECCQY